MSERNRFFRNVLIKALILFAAVNGVFAAINLMPALGRISIYNTLIPGRTRLPYGEDQQADYNLSLYNLEAMFASHEAAARPSPGPLRVMLIGDSATWGFLLTPEQTLASRISRNSGGAVRVYNFGYPTMTLTKDLLMLSHAMRYEPDLIIWLVTLESMPQTKQLASPILQNNAEAVRALIAQYRLHSDPQDPRLIPPTLWDRTLIGGRRALADLIRLQIYGFLWAATGVDQAIPAAFDPPQSDLEADESFHGLLPPSLKEEDLAFDVLAAGREMAGGVPLWIINEPVYVSRGLNSGIRYNFFYPRWAYDQYRTMLADWCRAQTIVCYDFWDLVPAEEFSNSAIHRTPRGEAMLADALETLIAEETHGR
ncbi:MAG: hypothetical protein WBM17_15965 [Anaerolineales bacterium]